MKKKLMRGILSLIVATTMFCSTMVTTNVYAAEEETESEEARYQEPVEITEFGQNDNSIERRRTGSFDVVEEDVSDFPMVMSASSVVAGTVSDYLVQAEDAKIYNIGIPAGVYFQAQLNTPANANIDYDMYLLDSEGNILVGSDYYTMINGNNGTLPEAMGYITSGESATYYIYVLSSVGGSVSEPFTLDYSISNSCDNFEIDESAREALPFTFGTDGAYINSRNLNSPIDNDWYIITVPESRTYNKLRITATTDSVNTCKVEVYQNAMTNGYSMSRVGNGDTVTVSTGTYYVRVSNALTMEDFDDNDIQNYTLEIAPVLTATGITIESMSGTEGEKYVTYSGYGRYFRTGTGNVSVTGYAIATDPTTNENFYVADTPVTIMYYNPHWDQNNTPSLAYAYAYGNTDANGRYQINISLPTAMGALCVDTGVSYHYFDFCAMYSSLTENANIRTYKPFYHLSYSDYHSF